MNTVANMPATPPVHRPAPRAQGANHALWAWVLIGLAAYVVLPWYAIQDANGLTQIGAVFSDEQAGNGLMQAMQWGRSWLLAGMAGLVVAGVAAAMPAGKKQGAVLVIGAGLGLLALLVSGFAIGARGWSYEWMNHAWGELEVRQFGFGWGAFVALTSLMVLLAFGLARRGFFKGDLFVAAAVVGCGGLLALFIVYPVTKALSGAFFTEDDQFLASAIIGRIFNETKQRPLYLIEEDIFIMDVFKL